MGRNVLCPWDDHLPAPDFQRSKFNRMMIIIVPPHEVTGNIIIIILTSKYVVLPKHADTPFKSSQCPPKTFSKFWLHVKIASHRFLHCNSSIRSLNEIAHLYNDSATTLIAYGLRISSSPRYISDVYNSLRQTYNSTYLQGSRVHLAHTSQPSQLYHRQTHN